jgi:hypothetical protein
MEILILNCAPIPSSLGAGTETNPQGDLGPLCHLKSYIPKFCVSNDIIHRVRKQHREQEKISANHFSLG